MNEIAESVIPANAVRPRTRWRSPFALVLALGAIAILLVAGRALLPDRSLMPLDLLHQGLLPWANDVREPGFTDQYGIDVVQEYLPTYTFLARALRAGQLPTWNPYNRGGSPHLDNPVSIPFHPLLLLLIWLSPDQVYDFQVVLHFGFAFLAMALYLRAARLHSGAVLFGALSWTFCAFFSINCLHGRSIAALSLLPLVLLCLERFLAKPESRRVWQLGLVLGFTLLIADPAGILAMTVVLGLKLFGHRLFEAPSLRGKLGGIVCAGLIACAAAAPVLLSEAEGLATSVRAFEYGGPYAWSQSVLRTIGGYLALLVATVHPYALGSRASIDALKPFGYTIAFIPFAGTFALPFAAVAARRLWTERRWRWVVLTFAAGLVLQYPSVVAVLADRNVIVIAFALVLAAALGMDRFLAMNPAEIRRSAKLLLAFTGLAWAAFLARELVLHEFGPRLLETLTKAIQANLSGYLFERYAEWKLASAGRFLALQHLWSAPNVLFLAGLSVFSIAWYRAARRPVLVLACLAPVVFGAANVHVFDEVRYPLPLPAPGLALAPTDLAPPRVLVAREGVDNRLLLTAMLPQLYGLAQVRGYGSLFPLNPDVLTSELPPEHPLYEVVGVNYLVTARDSTTTSPAFPEKVHGGDMNVYARTRPASRFHVTGRLVQVGTREAAAERARADTRAVDARSFYVTTLSPAYRGEHPVAAKIRVLDESPTRIALDVEADADALLVIGDTHYRGWRASIDGAAAAIDPVDGALRGISLHQGRNAVRLDYVHWPSRIGFGMQLGLSIVAIGAVVMRRRRAVSR
ncbi:MAG: hypothetical protein HY749_02925 [Gammaproteobacteria bacterium]|nr:hypothetical protein [Gammaproteobacteria bacterium]MBI5616665.1 hypothetical protein [Gammaproteobacteria bacterium]